MFACLRWQQSKDGMLPAGRPVRIVAAPSHSHRHQHRLPTSPARQAQQLWPGMEHGHAAPPFQREQVLRQAQVAESAQLQPQQRRDRQPGGTRGQADAACRFGAPVVITVGSQTA